MNLSNENINMFCKVLTMINDENECMEFLQDVCTINELEDFAQRLQVACLLKEGKSYNEICSITGASTATISRVNRCYKYNNGYKIALNLLNGEDND